MAFKFVDRVQETCTGTGTGALTLGGAVTGYRAFSAALSDGDTFQYTIEDRTTGAWEMGLGTFNSGAGTISRGEVFSSSNAGALVNFAAGTKYVFCSYPARQVSIENATQYAFRSNFY